MARFSYVAQAKDGSVTRGAIEAMDRTSALQSLLEKGLQPIKIEAIAGEAEAHTFWEKLTKTDVFKSNLTALDQIMIVRHLGTILSTGTDLLSGLDIIARDSIKPRVKQVLYDVKNRVSRGEQLSNALNAWKDQFNPIFINLVKSGEVSGNLPAVLLSYAQELRKDYAFLRKLRGAMFYPAILISALFGMVLIVLTVVTPRLKELFTSLKTLPPIYIRFFFWLSDILNGHLIVTGIVILLLIVTIVVGLKNRKVRSKLIVLFRYIPLLNRIQKNLTLMRLSKTVASLIQSGFSLKAALITTSQVVDDRYRDTVLAIAQKSLEHGITLADSMKKHPELFPDLLVSAVATGEKSGKLSAVLGQMAEFYEEDVLYSLETFLTLLEPILLVIVGVVVGLMAGAMISPIYRLIGKF